MTCFPLCFVPHGWGVNTTCNATQCIATHCNWGFNITVNASCVRVYAYEYEYEYEAVTWATLTGVVWLFFSLQVLALFLVSFYYVSRPRSRFTQIVSTPSARSIRQRAVCEPMQSPSGRIWPNTATFWPLRPLTRSRRASPAACMLIPMVLRIKKQAGPVAGKGKRQGYYQHRGNA